MLLRTAVFLGVAAASGLLSAGEGSGPGSGAAGGPAGPAPAAGPGPDAAAGAPGAHSQGLAARSNSRRPDTDEAPTRQNASKPA
ncbi:polysaccharide deacetylase family protein, partial [Streptomyces xanthophaeus]